MTNLRPAIQMDFDFLRGFGDQPADDQIMKQISDQRLRIIESDARPIGFIKFYVLWETLPFIEVILIDASERRQGHGTRAIRAWEAEMTNRGFDLVLISTRADESAQHFWRKISYSDCGTLVVSDKQSEIFMQHKLTHVDRLL